MKIAYLITGLGLGGAEVVTVNLANKMVERSHQVMIIYLNGTNEHTERIDPSIEVVGIDMDKTPVGLWRALRRAEGIVKQFKPDVMHGNMVHANLFVRLLRMFVRIPKVISSEHSMDIRGRGRMWAYRLTDTLSDVNTNVSQESVEHFVRSKAFSARKSRAMYNGINTKLLKCNPEKGAEIRRQYSIDDHEFLFLHVGRLTQAKNHALLLDAFARTTGAKLLLLGKGELQQQVENQAAELALGDRLILAGAHPNVVDYYSAADCLVLSSSWEGLPTVVLEAMSCEVPVVTTDVGGAHETIGDDRWIVAPKELDVLSDAMQQAINTTKEERVKWGSENRSKAMRFDIEHICSEWEAIYAARR